MDKNSAIGKGVRTAIQAMVGLVVGLVVAVWAVPGVPEVVTSYLVNNALQVLLLVGVPAGAVAYLQNKAGK